MPNRFALGTKVPNRFALGTKVPNRFALGPRGFDFQTLRRSDPKTPRALLTASLLFAFNKKNRFFGSNFYLCAL